ncbi:MAG: hydantoinase B/oxoprolinase family protein, partial [Gemmatimonadota bacterium]
MPRSLSPGIGRRACTRAARGFSRGRNSMATRPKPRAKAAKPAFDPLEITVMANAFAMIAEEMGTVMIRGALSPNIRERR